MILGIGVDFVACELCGTTIPVRRNINKILNVNTPPSYFKPCFNVYFVVKMNIEHKSNF